ncbi:hypothetical protein BTVI_109182 [Pitangus sulphuratus]|nr:hypothetical protein BTVI_109182 [Pitangus sulphuratus]
MCTEGLPRPYLLFDKDQKKPNRLARSACEPLPEYCHAKVDAPLEDSDDEASPLTISSGKSLQDLHRNSRQKSDPPSLENVKSRQLLDLQSRGWAGVIPVVLEHWGGDSEEADQQRVIPSVSARPFASRNWKQDGIKALPTVLLFLGSLQSPMQIGLAKIPIHSQLCPDLLPMGNAWGELGPIDNIQVSLQLLEKQVTLTFLMIPH